MNLLRTVCLIILISNTVRAQDNHYSWMQYGSRNSILYNAGISRFEDQSAVITNPATLSHARSSSFNFNSNIVGYNKITFENGLGQDFTIKSSSLNVLPSMAAGIYKPKNAQKDLVIGYALYHSNTDNLSFSDRSERKLNLINEVESPGEENYLAQYSLDNGMDEFTVVAGFGWNLSEQLSIGISQSFTYRDVESREAFAAYVVVDPAALASIDLVGSNLDFNAEYNTLMTFTKLGFHYSGEKWDLGVTINSPSLGIFGSGSILADYSLSNYRLRNDLTIRRRSFLANGQIEDIKAKYKYPLSATLGGSRLIGKARVFGAVSWYSSLKKYTVMDPGTASFIQPPSADNVLITSKALSIWSSNKTVVNASIAVDWELKSQNHFLFSFRNDQHYAEIDPTADGNNLAKKIWNNWHLIIGNQREFKSSALIIGMGFNYGVNNAYPQPASFQDPSEGNLLQGERGKGKVTSTGMKLLLSYTFALGNKNEN